MSAIVNIKDSKGPVWQYRCNNKKINLKLTFIFFINSIYKYLLNAFMWQVLSTCPLTKSFICWLLDLSSWISMSWFSVSRRNACCTYSKGAHFACLMVFPVTCLSVIQCSQSLSDVQLFQFMDCSSPGSSCSWDSQLEATPVVAIPFSRDLSLRYWASVSYIGGADSLLSSH